jgi:hypothetical protein
LNKKIHWDLCNPTPEFYNILTKIYGPKVFLLTKIKPEYSDILYDATYFPVFLVCRIRQGHLEIGRKLEPDILDIRGIVKNNPKQYNAIQKALISSFHLIQGPPGINILIDTRVLQHPDKNLWSQSISVN